MSRPLIYEENWPELVENYLVEKKKNQGLPTVEEVALEVLHCDTDTITNYVGKINPEGKNEYPEFFGAIEKLKMMQKHLLCELGVKKIWHAGMVQFLLMNNHNMSSNQRFIVTSPVKRDPAQIYYIVPEGAESVTSDN